MKLLRPAAPFDIDVGFPANDALSRVQTGATVVNVLQLFEDDFTLFLDSPWGSGKSVFCQRLKRHLESRGFPCIYFDAFANDLSGDAYTSLVGELYGFVSDKLPKAQKLKSDFLDVASAVGRSLVSTAIKATANAATAGLLGPDNIKRIGSISDDVAKSIAETIDQTADELIAKAIAEKISSHESQKSSIAALKKKLTEVAALLSESHKNGKEENPHQKLVVIVDELDRCKPIYALELLEVIKHLLSTSNVTFLISADGVQLQNTIRHVYGAGIDASVYLEKFFDLRLSFGPQTQRGVNEVESFVRGAGALFPDDGEGGQFKRQLMESLIAVAQDNGYSFRTIEKITNRMLTAASQMGVNTLRVPPVVVALSVLDVCDPGLFRKLSMGAASLQEVETFFGLTRVSIDQDGSRGFMARWLRFCLTSEISADDPISRMSSSLFPYSIDRKQIIPVYCQRFFYSFSKDT